MKAVRGFRAALWHTRFLLDPVAIMSEAYQRLGPVCVLGNVLPQRRGQLHVLALGPDLNRQVLGDPDLFHNCTPNPPSAALGRIRYGLTAMNGAKHRRQRKLVLPPFTKKAVEGYTAAMIESVGAFVDRWPAGQVVEMRLLMRRLTLRLSASLLFGREAPERVNLLDEMIQEYLHRSGSKAVHVFPFNWPGTPYRGLRRHAERIERELLAIFQERGPRPGDHPDLIDLLIQAHHQEDGRMTLTDLLGQAFILLAASYENVANALTWTLFLVAQHPNIAIDLCEELGSEPLTADRIERLPLLEAVIKESLRILPPVTFTVRVASRATELGGVHLRPGDRVACSPYVTHHLPDLFAEPERFQPRRWFEINPGPYDYLPFGAGPRFCLGHAFAMTEMKVALAQILLRWRFAVVPGSRIDRWVRVTMGPRYGMPMRLHPPDRQFHGVRVRGNIHEMVQTNLQ